VYEYIHTLHESTSYHSFCTTNITHLSRILSQISSHRSRASGGALVSCGYMRRYVSAETIANPGQMSKWQARRMQKRVHTLRAQNLPAHGHTPSTTTHFGHQQWQKFLAASSAGGVEARSHKNCWRSGTGGILLRMHLAEQLDETLVNVARFERPHHKLRC